MEDRHRDLLRRRTVIFRKDLDPKKIIPHLVKVLDAEDEQQIKNQPTREDQVDKMLEIIPQRGPDAFQCFATALKNVPTQAFLGDMLFEDEAKENELGFVRSNSAMLRIELESEKNKQVNIRKELTQSRKENEKLISNNSELKNNNERLSKNLEAEKQEKLVLQKNCSKLERELQLKNKVIQSIKINVQRKHTSINHLNSRKMSTSETQKKLGLLRRRTNSAKSERILTKREEMPRQIGGLNNNILYDNCEVEFMEHNAEVMELKRKLDHLTTERDVALACCRQLQEELKLFEEKRNSQIDKATTPMEDAGLHGLICSKCVKHESDLKELQQAKEKEAHKLKEEKRKIASTLKEVTDKYEREKKNLESKIQNLEGQFNITMQDFANQIENVRNEKTAQHNSEKNDLIIAKNELASQVQSNIQTISGLRGNLKSVNINFREFKKKTKSDKKELKDQIKSKESTLADLEAELREARDEVSRSLQDIRNLTVMLNEQQAFKDQLTDELTRWRSLPGRVFNFKKEFDRNGIIYNLGTSFNTTKFINPASNDNCRIKVSRSSCSMGNAMDILDLAREKLTVSCTADKENSWWQVDLGETHALFVTHYTLRHGNDKAHSFLTNWNLEGSRDGKKFEPLRRHHKDRSIKNGTFPFHTGNWTVEGRVEAMRYFRIIQTGPNSSGRHALYLSGFEIYGVLLSL